MEEPIFGTEDKSILEAQVNLIRAGMAEIEGIVSDEGSLTEEDFQALLNGRYKEMSLKKQYWIGRYYKAGFKAKAKKENDIKKVMSRPATLADVSSFVTDLIYGKDGLREGLESWRASVTSYVALMGEALRLKGILTPEDIDAAKASLDAQAARLREGIKTEAAKDVAETINPPESTVEAQK
jgi:hypothetical protein